MSNKHFWDEQRARRHKQARAMRASIPDVAITTTPRLVAVRVAPSAASAPARPAQPSNSAHLREALDSVSAVAPAKEQTSILDLEGKFTRLRDAELHAYATDSQPIGLRIGVADVAEPTIKAVAIYVKERRNRVSERTWFIVGGTLAVALAGLLGWAIGKLP